MHSDVQATFCSTLVDQWARDGVRLAFVAPGSRSTPMAIALAEHRDIALHICHDERTAAFAALGSGAVSGVPALALCTSGTAAAHFHAAVVEAHLSAVPMIVLTADRPPELRDVGAPQTIDQTRLFGPAVRWFHDPGVPASEASASWRALARATLERSVASTPGPVHLNLPFREPLVGAAGDLPAPALGPVVRPAPALRLGTLAMTMQRESGIIVAGRGVDDPAAVGALSAATGWPVFADPRSRCRGLDGSVAAFDALLRHEGVADHLRPDVVLHLGEPPASKVLAQWLASLAGAVQVRVDPWGRIIDPSHTITHRVVAAVGEFCRRLAGETAAPVDRSWSDRWLALGRLAESTLDTVTCGPVLTEAAVARRLTARAGELVVASSMPIRDVEWYGVAEQAARVWCNRGANGIDGTVATAIGVAATTGATTHVLVGDVALVHDSSSLVALAQRGFDIRIVVVDNDGGGIFSFLPQADRLDRERFEMLFGTPHGTDLMALATAHHLPTATVSTIAELDEWLDRPGPWLVRVPSERTANTVEHRRLNDAVVAAIGG